jgi:adenylate cyclase
MDGMEEWLLVRYQENPARTLVLWARSELDPAALLECAGEILSSRGQGYLVGKTIFAPVLAGLCGRAGHREAALQMIADALDYSARGGERSGEPELHRVRGELLAASDESEAERCFVTAVEVAREQGSKLFELRALSSLSRIQTGSSRKATSRTLRRLLRTFTGEHETPDLADARQLVSRIVGGRLPPDTPRSLESELRSASSGDEDTRRVG